MKNKETVQGEVVTYYLSPEEVLRRYGPVAKRHCQKCGRLLPLREFAYERRARDLLIPGTSSVCRKCQKVIKKGGNKNGRE